MKLLVQHIGALLAAVVCSFALAIGISVLLLPFDGAPADAVAPAVALIAAGVYLTTVCILALKRVGQKWAAALDSAVFALFTSWGVAVVLTLFFCVVDCFMRRSQ